MAWLAILRLVAHLMMEALVAFATGATKEDSHTIGHLRLHG